MRKIFRSEYFPIMVLLSIALVIGTMTFRDYSESFDEGEIFWYGDYSLKAYAEILKGNVVQDFELPGLNYYGPSYFMLASFFSNTAEAYIPNLTFTQAWHFVTFITFLLGSFTIYLLARRWISAWAAFGTTFLYLTQPLLWGHAFINPKDIPFQTFFLMSIVSGLWMCDEIFASNRISTYVFSFINFLNRQIQILMHFLRSKTARRIAIVWLFSIVFLWVFGGILESVLRSFIGHLYSAAPDSFLGYWFAKLASKADIIPVESYVGKAIKLLHTFKISFTVFGILFIVGGYYLLSPFRIKLTKNLQSLAPKLLFPLRKLPILLAGFILGLTCSIRILGPLAGAIVSIYALRKYGKMAILPLVVYALTAIGIMYLTWPFLWNAPLTKFYDAITTMSAYPWAGEVLYAGTFYTAHNLPWLYLPVLISIQLTEPTVLLFVVGFVITLLNLRRKVDADLFILLAFWFVIPMLGLIITRRPLYDNFRQLLFLLPPMFLLCGIALEFIFQYFNRLTWVAIFLLIVVSPGIFSIFSLHPYQYIYYNAIVGGPAGAFRHFELDYWCLSYQEATDYLNANAPIGTTIIVPIGYHLLHTRPDIIVKPSINLASEKYDYVVLKSFLSGDERFPDDRTVLSIRRGGAILTVVKQSSNNGPGKQEK